MKYKFIFLFSLFLLITSCQTYTSENTVMRSQLYSGNISGALETIDKSSLATEKRNYSLFRMEKGMLLYLNGQYTQATNLWIESDHHIEDLYTTSISRTAASFAINDSMSDYRGEAHERVLLPLFTSLAFFEQKNLENSLVMIRRTYNVINQLRDENEGKNTFQNDIFPHYFSAMIFEAKNDLDNAIVEYRQALSVAKDQQARTQILKDLGRLGSFKQRSDILTQIKKENSNLTWEKQSFFRDNGEIYIIYECGNSPIKRTVDILVPTDKTTVRISFPDYVDVPYRSHFATIFLNKKNVGETIILENIGGMARQALADRRLKDLAKMTARVIAKDIAARKLGEENQIAGIAANIFNIASEVADTRSWSTLPDSIQIFRIPVKAHQSSTIEIKPQNGSGTVFTVNLNPGEKRLYRLRTFD